MNPEPKQSPLHVAGESRRGRSILDFIVVDRAVCAEETTQNEPENAVRTSECRGGNVLFPGQNVNFQTPDECHDRIAGRAPPTAGNARSEEHTSELQSLRH